MLPSQQDTHVEHRTSKGHHLGDRAVEHCACEEGPLPRSGCHVSPLLPVEAAIMRESVSDLDALEHIVTPHAPVYEAAHDDALVVPCGPVDPTEQRLTIAWCRREGLDGVFVSLDPLVPRVLVGDRESVVREPRGVLGVPLAYRLERDHRLESRATKAAMDGLEIHVQRKSNGSRVPPLSGAQSTE